MKIVGVTGTNGKTTTTHLLFQIFRAAGLSAGLIGTVGNQIDGEQFPATHTTPESDELQRIFAVMAERGVQAAAIEVSSHALAQYRVDGTRFATVGFTNLTQDHLDYHGTMENYFAAKSRLFGRDFASQGS
ncbi:MAG: UDP-N-acetylmuramoyl-L-alanyl-D-glutamate--2,6-diaminopimelate ligase, partial [Actinobacteria bacterium]|nr:UDP-N-acetylmuramoyl-L-alanyl-D-glutamate--2,6-diaminopimelate ligase [Actinomycetota bacterium]